MVNIYSPATKEVKDYGLGQSIDVTINGNAVIPILADKIYKSAYSSIRELYANEVTAVKKALRINPKLNPEILITIDTNTRELIIKGIDSLGIDTDTFKYILAVMGNSGNNNENETGYYGLGFFSFVKMSERIKINSYSLESGEKWACIAKSALKFEQLPTDSYKPLKKTGFEVTLTIKNDLDIIKIAQKVREISKLSGVKTSLYVDEVNQPLEQYNDLMDYFKSKYSGFFDGTSKYSLMYEHINNDDYELIIGYHTSGGENLQEAFLINVPIKLDFPRYDFPKIALLNVKNERIYKPSADRERFNEKDEETLIEELKNHAFEPKDKLEDLENINEWYDSKFRYFYDYVNDLSLRTYVKTGLKRDTWDNSLRPEYLIDVLPAEKPKELRISKTLRTKTFEKYKKDNVFAVKTHDISDYEDFIKVGFIDIDHGKKKKSRSYSGNSSRLTNKFKFHNIYGSFNELPNDALAVIRVNDVRDTNLRTDMRTDKIFWIPQRANYNNTIEHSELENLLDENKTYFTNKGILKTSHIMELSKRFKVLENTNDFNIKENMSYFYNFNPEYLIVRLDKSEQSKLLESILRDKNRLKRHYDKYGNFYNNIDFNGMKREKQKNRFKEWKTKITDPRLKILIDKLCINNIDDNDTRIVQSLQISLNGANKK